MLQVAGWDALDAPAVQAFKTVLDAPGSKHGLSPLFLARFERDGNTSAHAHFVPGTVSLGARGDSYYEYLLKQYLFSGGQDDVFLERYVQAMSGVRDWLLGETAPPATGVAAALRASGHLAINLMSALPCARVI